MTLPVTVLALVASTSAAHADARIAHGNDAFSELVPPLDDTGFTTDLAFAMWRPWRGTMSAELPPSLADLQGQR